MQQPPHEQQPQRKKNTTVYILLMVGPFLALVVSAVIQIVARAMNVDDGIALTIINVLSFLIGLLSVLAILALPLWIVLLIRTLDYNKQINS